MFGKTVRIVIARTMGAELSLKELVLKTCNIYQQIHMLQLSSWAKSLRAWSKDGKELPSVKGPMKISHWPRTSVFHHILQKEGYPVPYHKH